MQKPTGMIYYVSTLTHEFRSLLLGALKAGTK